MLSNALCTCMERLPNQTYFPLVGSTHCTWNLKRSIHSIFVSVIILGGGGGGGGGGGVRCRTVDDMCTETGPDSSLLFNP